MRPPLLASLCVALLPACQQTEQVPSPPTTWEYQINFFSKDAAISADTLDVTVFDATVSGHDCQSLVARRRTSQSLPTPALATTSQPVCGLLSESAPTSAATPYGDYSVLVVARRGTKDWLIGCQLQQVFQTTETPPLQIDLTPFDNTVQVLLASGCSSLSQYCQGQCQRP